MAENPIVELLECPALTLDQAMMKLLHLDPSQEVAHRHSRRTRIPIYVAGRACLGEPHTFHQHFAGAFIAE